MIPWTLALKQFLTNGKEEKNCPKYFAVAHTEITGLATPPQGSVEYQPTITGLFFFFNSYFFYFCPQQKQSSSSSIWNWTNAICYQQLYTHEPLPRSDFVSGKHSAFFSPPGLTKTPRHA